MAVTYSTGKAKCGNRERQLKVRTKLNRWVQSAFMVWGKKWTQLPAGRADWNILRRVRDVASDEELDDYDSDDPDAL